jgi:signal transduction histidine kinase
VNGNVALQVEPTLFRRALSNLISNALNHTPAGGKIEMRLLTEQGWSQVEVRDSGSGIKAKHLPYVFDRLFRAEESRHTGGVGLGLSIVKSIMDLHRGIVAIDSTENHGTIVTMRFPSREYGCRS